MVKCVQKGHVPINIQTWQSPAAQRISHHSPQTTRRFTAKSYFKPYILQLYHLNIYTLQFSVSGQLFSLQL